MKEVKVEFESFEQHANQYVLPYDKFLGLKRYLYTMFPEYSFSINKEATQVMLNHSLDKDYVVINLDKGYMINSVSYYSNEVVDEDKD